MKKLHLIAPLIFLMILAGCSEKEKKESGVENKSETKMENKASANEKRTINEKVAGIETASATFQEKLETGEIFMLTKNGEPIPYEFKRTKIKTLQLPDGKFHQVEEKNGRMWMTIPGKGEMQVLRLSGKVYMFDNDDQAYEVKVMNNELIAEATVLTDVILSRK